MECVCNNECNYSPQLLLQCRQELEDALKTTCENDSGGGGLLFMIPMMLLIPVLIGGCCLLYTTRRKKFWSCFRRRKNTVTYTQRIPLQRRTDAELERHANRRQSEPTRTKEALYQINEHYLLGSPDRRNNEGTKR